MDYERKYLKYKKKYLFLKKQIGGQKTVQIYDKSNYRNLLYTIELEEDDDINILKYKIRDINNQRGLSYITGIDEINIYQHNGFCVEPKLNAITDTMNNFCMSINPVRKFSPIPMRTGLVPSLGKKEFSNIRSNEYYISRSIIDGDTGNFDGLVTKGYYLDNDTHIDLVEGNGTYKSFRRDLAIQVSLEGHFLNNKLVEGTKRVSLDGISKEYIGKFVNNNLVNGNITIFDPNRTILEIYEGSFDENELITEGSITRKNGQIERGTFKNNLLEGMGSIEYPDGRVVSGNYSQGVIQRKENLIINNMDYQKYLKYKNKYLIFKEQMGGTLNLTDKQSTYKNACIALFYNKHIFLVLQKDGSWNIPGGHIDPGENSFQAAFREFKEETGGFNLKQWANSGEPKKKFNSYGYHGHTEIWWYVSKEDPKIIFNINNETVKGQWFQINNLPTLRFSETIQELITLVSSKL